LNHCNHTYHELSKTCFILIIFFFTVVKSAKYDEEDDDYLICKALAKNYDQESYKKLLVLYGLTDVIDLDEFF